MGTMTILVLLLLPIALLMLGVPIFLVLMATSLFGVFVVDSPLHAVHTAMFGSLDSFPLLAVPLFIYAGDIMSRGGIARRLIELRNKAETDLRHTEKQLASAGDKLSPDQRDAITIATAALRSAIAGSDLNTLQKAIDAFGVATNPLALIVMNEVLLKGLGGTEADKLDPNKL